MLKNFILIDKKLCGWGEKTLLSYHCIIKQIYLATEVQVLHGIVEILESMNTMDLGLIRDAANPLGW